MGRGQGWRESGILNLVRGVGQSGKFETWLVDEWMDEVLGHFYWISSMTMSCSAVR